MYFSSYQGRLQFRVHLKDNQELKYLNSGSTHTKCCIRAIPQGVFNRLAKLTSNTCANTNQRMTDLYPIHGRALGAAGILPDEIPRLGDVLGEMKESTNKPRNCQKSLRNRKRQSFFCIGMSDVWRGKKAVSTTLKKLRNKHGLRWMRILLSYHQFPNFRELLQGDLNTKLLKGITCKDF